MLEENSPGIHLPFQYLIHSDRPPCYYDFLDKNVLDFLDTIIVCVILDLLAHEDLEALMDGVDIDEVLSEFHNTIDSIKDNGSTAYFGFIIDYDEKYGIDAHKRGILLIDALYAYLGSDGFNSFTEYRFNFYLNGLVTTFLNTPNLNSLLRHGYGLTNLRVSEFNEFTVSVKVNLYLLTGVRNAKSSNASPTLYPRVYGKDCFTSYLF